MKSFIGVLVFISTATLLYSIMALIILKPKSTQRLEKYFNPQLEIEEKDLIKPKKRLRIKIMKGLNDFGTRISENLLMKKHLKRAQGELLRAGLPLKAEELLSIQFIGFVTLFSMSYYASQSMSVSLILGSLGWILPGIIVKLRRTKRYKLFNEQLGDGIVLISNSLKAGYSFLQAVDSIATEMPPPISDEFKKVLKELRLGVDTEKALENLLERVDLEDLELVVTAVMIQREIGGNLSEILDNISGTIRGRIKLKGEIRTLTAQGRISGIVISMLPIALGGVLFVINPEYIMTLFRNKYGLIIVGVSILNQIIGAIAINKIVKIEV